MDWCEVKETEKLLLLGEANFSFSLSLCKSNKHAGATFSNFYSTCYESSVECPQTLDNIQLLKSFGFNVILGVDATNLSQHPDIGHVKFDRIIFNFPHIKGKMKINLNRELIREFFISSADILAEGGCVVVALCSGQGGTHFEKTPRKWENTWQVVEMAAHADYVLAAVHPFPNDLFPEYVSSGFRGKSKSFNTCDALIHLFTRASPPLNFIDRPTLDTLIQYHPIPNHMSIKVPRIYSKLLERNPFDFDSPQNYFKDVLISLFKHVPSVILSSELALTVPHISNDSHQTCKINGVDRCLRKSLVEVLPNLSPENNYIYWGVVFQQLTSDFSVCPIKCQAVVVGKFFDQIFLDFLDKLKDCIPDIEFNQVTGTTPQNLNLVATNVRKEKRELITFTNVMQDGQNFRSWCVDLDEISFCLLQLESWKQLWSETLSFTTSPVMTFTVPHFSSQPYSFDINFITTPEFSLESFVNLLWQIGENMICAVLLLNSYEHSNNETVSNCYRIVYKSYEKPLYRKRVVSFHANVIGKAMQLLYNVVIC